MPKTQRPKLRLHRESVRRLAGADGASASPRPVFHTQFCGQETSGCTWIDCTADTCALA